ncbi:unnamed protein product [Rhizophagus irregularis]|nr:unnamed protein product [Rhizophagus irregularis]
MLERPSNIAIFVGQVKYSNLEILLLIDAEAMKSFYIFRQTYFKEDYNHTIQKSALKQLLSPTSKIIQNNLSNSSNGKTLHWAIKDLLIKHAFMA